MRWVDRGHKPDGVAAYAEQFTQGWVDHFPNGVGVGERPTDSRWGEFRSTLGGQTNNICWYCERQCGTGVGAGWREPTVDHFRPLRRFPRLAYEWSNWVFSCRMCNVVNKQDKWPDTGYVDPCASDVAERPEHYFDYDELTGELIPKEGLSGTTRQKATHTINDLGLNKKDVKDIRFRRIRRFKIDLLSMPTANQQDFIELFTQQPVEYAGAVGMVVEQLRQDGYI